MIIEILNDYQLIISVFVAAGLTFLVYFKILRVNNFLHYSEKFQERIQSVVFIEEIEYKNGNLYNKNNGKELTGSEEISLVSMFNLIADIGLLLKQGLISKKLVYNRFGNFVYDLCTRHRPIIDYIEINVQSNSISSMHQRFMKRGKRHDKYFAFRKKVSKLFGIKKATV